ncbi:flippase activity-associated protein Agl23 [Thermogemmatispora carboxidivorans]|uniref:flippase activity-associated protein Agl23 n=1 Tax=Thermogemmatispora carboxidivorans TaxID=1382306 RepID=UPI00069C7739|nr:flippase activity-associated protein Agl23 [Thermogemmatispora carboxidivorans]
MNLKRFEHQPVESQSDQSELLAGAVTEQTASLEQERSVAQARHWPPGRTLRHRRPSRSQVLEWVAYGVVLVVAAVLRFWDLGVRPLHHDESLHAYFSLQLSLNILSYHYDPLLHGPFQFHAMALVYKLAQLVGVPDHGVNTTTVRLLAATLGTVLVGLPYLLRRSLGRVAAWLATVLLAVSPSLVYYSRFAREDIYMACFTLLLVVGLVRYVQERKLGWLLVGVLGLALSYATKEATFLTIAVMGSYGVGVLMWELGSRWKLRERVKGEPGWLPRTWAPFLLLAYALVGAVLARWLLGWLHNLSLYITAHQQASDEFVAVLKDDTALVVPWLGVALGLVVLGILLREIFQGEAAVKAVRGGWRLRLAQWVDEERQPVLATLVKMPWTHWFFALLLFWAIFLVLFTVLFTNVRAGIGDGIWGGLYYWIEQIAVARGGQPWYYYLLLIPLYEQVGVIFGIVGLVRCVLRPTRLRLWLVYWCVGNLVLYSWAAEKMPWLTIHITLPLMVLAGLGLEPGVSVVLSWLQEGWRRWQVGREAGGAPEEREREWKPREELGGRKLGWGLLTVLVGFVLLVPTVHNMYEVTYVHEADAPHEMLIYVQTTTDVDRVMAKIDELDRKLDGGRHQLAIGVMNDAIWPFIWYLRDYPHACYNYPADCPNPSSYPVIIAGGDNLYLAETQYADTATHTGDYLFHQYHMRSWWDEGYKPPPCLPSKANNNCAGQQTWGGVGPLLWLSYGDNPPPGAQFNPVLAAERIWAWWWQRQPFGATDGAYDMGLFIKKGLGVTP